MWHFFEINMHHFYVCVLAAHCSNSNLWSNYICGLRSVLTFLNRGGMKYPCKLFGVFIETYFTLHYSEQIINKLFPIKWNSISEMHGISLIFHACDGKNILKVKTQCIAMVKHKNVAHSVYPNKERNFIQKRLIFYFEKLEDFIWREKLLSTVPNLEILLPWAKYYSPA